MAERPQDPIEQRMLQDLADYDFDGRNEADVRGDWIEPLLRLLGYGLGTAHKIIREQRLALDPPTRMLGSTRLEIDFVPTVFGQGLWLMEAKKPTGDLFSDEHLGQAWSYATDPRVAVPLIVLCDGQRIGVFDVTVPDWADDAFVIDKAQLPQQFDALRELLGARNVAERVRQRQLGHLRRALAAQVDLDALDKTVQDVRQLVEAVRPEVEARREDIRSKARTSARERGEEAVDRVGMWGRAQHWNTPLLQTRWADLQTMVECVLRQPPPARVREFDDFERATTPSGQQQTRMWFSLRAVRLAVAVTLASADGCGEHCRAVAERAAHDHATGFADDPLLAAGYRLQRALGALGWRVAPRLLPGLRDQVERLKGFMEPEEWLIQDGQIGMSAQDAHFRVTWMLPTKLLLEVEPWDVDTVRRAALGAEAALAALPRLEAHSDLQPAHDPWLDSWATGDPLRQWSTLLLDMVARQGDEAASTLARDLLDRHFGLSESAP